MLSLPVKPVELMFCLLFVVLVVVVFYINKKIPISNKKSYDLDRNRLCSRRQKIRSFILSA